MPEKRANIKECDKWDLSSLMKDKTEWEARYEAFKRDVIPSLASYKGKLGDEATLLEAFRFMEKAIVELEVINSYGFLNLETEGQNADFQLMAAKTGALISSFSAELAYFDPELLSLDEEYIKKVEAKAEFAPYKVYIEKLMHSKPHLLSEKEERLLSLSAEALSSMQSAFQNLNNVDFSFEPVFGRELTHGTYPSFMHDKDENVRRTAYENYYKTYDKHKNTIAALYQGSVNKDLFRARARNFGSALEAALYPDNVDKSVYLSLIDTVHKHLDALHRYYRLIARTLGKEKIHHSDVYMPLSAPIESHIEYDEAVALISEAIKPLGQEYRDTLIKGLTTERWVDRYENEGKRSGAFSAGCYTGKPYILTNYNADQMRSVSTLIHEGGHSMHSYYSARSNPPLSYDYTIFEAEVASTFNEELLSDHLIKNAASEKEKAYLLSEKLANIVATLFRQTMFAEFELIMHDNAEKGEAPTVASMRDEYGRLLRQYFGPNVEFSSCSDLEGMRIPHFYSAFYVYKYATGISAAMALSERVQNGGEKERNDYLAFLRSGGSRYPIDSLKLAGVDMSGPAPVEMAAGKFEKLLDQMERLI
jgi:oligoendopeptidase F